MRRRGWGCVSSRSAIVLNGGEVARVIIRRRTLLRVHGQCRILAGVLRRRAAEYPVFTKPAVWRGRVPSLTSGDHARVSRGATQVRTTYRRARPDLSHPWSSRHRRHRVSRTRCPSEAAELLTCSGPAGQAQQRTRAALPPLPRTSTTSKRGWGRGHIGIGRRAPRRCRARAREVRPGKSADNGATTPGTGMAAACGRQSSRRRHRRNGYVLLHG